MTFLGKSVGGLLLSLAATAGFAQGCSMCKTSAEAASAEQQKALNRGILMLAAPSVLIFGGLSIFAVRYRSKEADDHSKHGKDGSTDLL
jgi:heme/copper-type cytochrome/quinol oxidase subunit 2